MLRALTRRIALSLIGAALAAAPLAGLITPASAAEAKVTFVLVNDIDRIDGSKTRGGFSRLAAIVKAEKAKGGSVVYVHAGDSISPSLMSGFDKGAHIIELINMVPPDVFVPGNHEFDFGPEVFKQRMAELKAGAKLAANLRDEKGEPIKDFADQKMIEVDGVKIGILGVTADDAVVKSSPGNLRITESVKAASASAKVLRDQGANFVVAVAHANRGTDIALYQTGAFDLILTGDDHDLHLSFNGKTAMVESNEQGNYVTAIDVAIKTEERDGRTQTTWWPNFRVIDSATVTPDTEVEAKIETYRKELSRELDIEIAKVDVPLDSRRPIVRGAEAAIGNLITDAMRWATGADIAITNGGGIRANKQYAVGAPFTRRDVLSELPFGNKTTLVEATGEMVLAALENGVSQVEQEGGRFAQVSGLTFEYDKSKPAGSRVLAVKVAGAPLDPKKTYNVAINDFMFGGGDGYRMFRGAKTVLNERDAKLMANDVMAYVKERGKIGVGVEGRIVAK